MNSLPTFPVQAQKDEPLSHHTSIHVGGPADYFLVADSQEQIVQVAEIARTSDLPLTIIGGGTNILVSDTGVRGIVLRLLQTHVVIEGSTLSVGAGYNLTRLAALVAQQKLTGMEFAFGIPGTVGGAVYGNAGAFGRSMANIVDTITILTKHGTIETRTSDQMNFRYRYSILKETKETVLEVRIHLEHGDAMAITELQKQHLLYRREHQPLALPSLGSVFQNFPLDAFTPDLVQQYGLAKHAGNGTVAAGYLLDRLDLKGTRVGDAQVSEKHANFIVNHGNATAEQVVMLIGILKQKARMAFGGLALLEEIQYLGF